MTSSYSHLSPSFAKTISNNNRRTCIPLLLKILLLSLLISCISTLSTEETNAMCKLQSSMLISTWNTNCVTSACSWTGVTCTSNVTILDLNSLNIIGTLPTQIGNLRALNYINLATNPGLNGTLPTQIGFLTMLNTLDLSSTSIYGTLPTQTGFLTALIYLSIIYTQISGTLPTQMGLLTSLTSLYCYDTRLSGTIPTQFGAMTALNIVDLSATLLNGTLPTQIGYLRMLISISLSNTKIYGTLPTQTGYLTALHKLSFSMTKIKGTLPTQLGLLTSLSILECYDNQVYGTIPTQFGALTALNSILLSNTGLSGTLPTQIGFLTMLTTLDLTNTNIYGTIPTQTGFLTALSYLIISNTQISGTLPTQMGLLTSLSLFYCYNTPVSGTIPTQFGAMTALNSISFSYSEICGCFPYQWNSLSWTFCDVTNVPNDCNCPIPVICNPEICTPSACGSDCQLDYRNYFSCINGTWKADKDVTISSDLLDASFETVGVTISGSVLVTSSNFTVTNNFILETNSTLKIEDVNIAVNGDLYIHSDSTLQFLAIKNYSQFNIAGATYLDGGNLAVSVHSSQEEQRLVVFTFQSLNGSFSNINVSLTDKKYSCDRVESSTASSLNEFTVFFKINNCSSNSVQIPYWIWIIIGLILVVPIIGAVFYQSNVRNKKKKVLANIKKKVSGQSTDENTTG